MLDAASDSQSYNQDIIFEYKFEDSIMKWVLDFCTRTLKKQSKHVI